MGTGSAFSVMSKTERFIYFCGLVYYALSIAGFFFIWFVRLLALRPLLAYRASLG
jgi:hypothetical protein